jgi:prepilin-type N-terminal cleavage/methylation domain-containing protein
MRCHAGFSLIEMAMVMVILAAVIGGLVVPLTMQLHLNDIKTAKNDIQEIKHALLGFLVANQRLPCPATEITSGAEGSCASQHGFVPSATLGLSGTFNRDGLLLDPWGNPYRYSISNSDRSHQSGGACVEPPAPDGLLDFTTAGEIAKVGLNCLNNNLVVCQDSACTVRLTGSSPDGVPVVIFSMGKNWARTSTAPTSQNEQENLGDSVVSPNIPGLTYLLPGNMTFVSASYNEGRDTPSARFDDIVDWISPNLLYNRMVMAGIYP